MLGYPEEEERKKERKKKKKKKEEKIRVPTVRCLTDNNPYFNLIRDQMMYDTVLMKHKVTKLRPVNLVFHIRTNVHGRLWDCLCRALGTSIKKTPKNPPKKTAFLFFLFCFLFRGRIRLLGNVMIAPDT